MNPAADSASVGQNYWMVSGRLSLREGVSAIILFIIRSPYKYPKKRLGR